VQCNVEHTCGNVALQCKYVAYLWMSDCTRLQLALHSLIF